MTRQELIKKIEKVKEVLAWENIDDLTEYAREEAYICLDSAIEFIKENDSE